MSKINLFLQKMKMHESHHGIIMVVTAYALSFLMLVLGSDVFYNMKSAAAGITKETDEETEEIVSEDLLNPRIMTPETLVLQSNLINPYGLKEITNQEPSGNTSDTALSTENDNQWSIYQGDISLIEQMHSVKAAADEIEKTKETKKVKETKKAKTANTTKKTEKEAVESLSTDKKLSAVYDISKEEVDMLERIVEAEASGEDMVGKILIANVIFNRVSSDEFPNTVEKVIFQKSDGEYQFSPIADDRFWSVNVSDETEAAVKRALKGEDYSKGALYFMSRENAKKSSARWFDQQLDWLFKHGGHEFYK